MKLHEFPRYPLTFGPSPLQHLKRLTQYLGGRWGGGEIDGDEAQRVVDGELDQRRRDRPDRFLRLASCPRVVCRVSCADR